MIYHVIHHVIFCDMIYHVIICDMIYMRCVVGDVIHHVIVDDASRTSCDQRNHCFTVSSRVFLH